MDPALDTARCSYQSCVPLLPVQLLNCTFAIEVLSFRWVYVAVAPPAPSNLLSICPFRCWRLQSASHSIGLESLGWVYLPLVSSCVSHHIFLYSLARSIVPEMQICFQVFCACVLTSGQGACKNDLLLGIEENKNLVISKWFLIKMRLIWYHLEELSIEIVSWTL